MKIGDVARETGLTEKAIRLYVEQGLVKPEITQGTHRNSYDFSRENVHELERINIFRKAGFSLFEISVIQQQPERLPELIESKRQSLEADLETQESIREAMDRLQASEIGNPEQVARILRSAVEFRKDPAPRGSRRWKYTLFVVAAVLGAYLWMHYIGFYKSFHGWIPLTPFQELIIGGFLCLVLSMPALFMAVRYGTCTRRAERLPRHGTGTVIKVMEEHGFNGRFARAGMALQGAREQGIGGTWQINFMLWNEIRPDCWFPVIRYTDEKGRERSDTFSYGGFRNTWQPGDTVAIAWDPKNREILPREGRHLKQKAILYTVVGLVFLALSLWLFSRTMAPEFYAGYMEGSWTGLVPMP